MPFKIDEPRDQRVGALGQVTSVQPSGRERLEIEFNHVVKDSINHDGIMKP